MITALPVKVVSALILNEQHEMLMTFRNAGCRRPSCWENPGGKVEPGETDEEALRREVREELGVDSEVGALVSAARIDVEVVLHMMLYEVTILGNPEPLASQALEWVLPSQAIVWRICAPATYSYYRDIENHILRRIEGASLQIGADTAACPARTSPDSVATRTTTRGSRRT